MTSATPSPDPLRPAMTATLRAVAEQIPVTVPRWDDVLDGLARARRRRRLRIARRTAGTLLAVTGGFAALQVGVLPYPSWAPAVSVPGAVTQASLLSRQPTKGSLAGDAGWLRALRQKVGRYSQDDAPLERWRATSADDVRVIFAGDVGPYRLALVEVPLRSGVLQARMQFWYVGARGAAAADLDSGQSDDPADTAFAAFSQLPDGRNTAPVVVVVTAAQPSVEVAGPPTLTAQGTVRWPVRRLQATSQGLWTLVTDEGTHGDAYLRVGGGQWQPLYARPFPVPAEGPGRARYEALLASAQPALHPGAATVARDDLDSSVSQLVARFGLDLVGTVPATGNDSVAGNGSVARNGSAGGDGSAGGNGQVGGNGAGAGNGRDGTALRVLWSGPMDGWRATVLDVRFPSGGHLVDVQLTRPVPGEPGAFVGAGSSVPAPAGPVDRLAVAFQTEPTTHQGDAREPTGVGLVGPRTATTAQVTDARGGRHRVTLADGIGWAAVADATRAVFGDDHGAVLADVAVTPARWIGPLEPH